MSPSPRGKRAAPDDEHFELIRERNKRFRAELDLADADQAALHREALQKAASHHERIRQQAEQARERFYVEQQLAAQQNEILQQEAIARAREELAAREEQARQLRQQNERAAAEQQRREEEARQAAVQEAERQKREQAEQAASRKAQEDREKQARETQHQQQQQQQQQQSAESVQQAHQPVRPVPQQHTTTSKLEARDAEHQQYLYVHRELKQFRSQLMQTARSNKALKNFMGDNRREITKTVGQMTAGSSAEVNAANKNRIAAVCEILRRARQQEQPSVDVRKFLLASRHLDGPEERFQIPAVFVYLINMFAKAAVKQYIGEAGISPEKADPVGKLVANVFSNSDLQWKGTTFLIDILLAKYHKVCPVLFGIYGSLNTKEGRARSGWLPISVQDNSERMTGLGAGFASITLRDFTPLIRKDPKARNPLPVAELWRSIAMIVNTTPREAIDAQFLVLKALLEPIYVEKLIKFYGVHGVALVRKAVFDFPVQSSTAAANGLKVLPDLYKKARIGGF